MERAKITKVGGNLLVFTPYNSQLVEEIRGIPGRRWDASLRAWSVPVASEQQVRELVRKFYQIEGEPCYTDYDVLRVKVIGKVSASHVRAGGVSIDDVDIFNPQSGYLDMRPNTPFEILDYVGGIVGIKQEGEPFMIEYTLKIKVRKNAVWHTTGSGDYQGSYEILSGNTPIDKFLDSLFAEKEQ